MVEQYPDSITVTVISEPYQDENGDWISGEETATTYDCRAEANTGGQKIAGVDGMVYDYTFAVYMPRTSDIISQGSTYTLTKGNATFRGTVKGAINGQFNSRIWV